jgi:sporulation protein YlmC with PRC-barrel domain
MEEGMTEPGDTPASVAVEDERHALISSRRVEGTPVYDRAGEKLGSVHSVMIGKRSGKVAYAVLSFGGFLGIGEHVHQIPWDMLDYDPGRDGYVVDLTREQLEAAPTFRVDEADRPRERSQDELVYAYYGQLPWWSSAPY